MLMQNESRELDLLWSYDQSRKSTSAVEDLIWGEEYANPDVRCVDANVETL